LVALFWLLAGVGNASSTNKIVVAIGVLLLIAAIWFAWIGSRPVGRPEGAHRDERPAVERELEAFDWQAEGERVYAARCAGCHGAGERTRRVPALRGHVPKLFLADGGRDYLIDLLLFGFEGRLEVGSDAYDSRHPVYKDRLSDEEVAAVLNQMLVSWNNGQDLPKGVEFYRPEEVTQHRHRNFTAVQISKMREAIRLSP
jgi:mono/diheme cytochrome c family protein